MDKPKYLQFFELETINIAERKHEESNFKFIMFSPHQVKISEV